MIVAVVTVVSVLATVTGFTLKDAIMTRSGHKGRVPPDSGVSTTSSATTKQGRAGDEPIGGSLPEGTIAVSLGRREGDG